VFSDNFYWAFICCRFVFVLEYKSHIKNDFHQQGGHLNTLGRLSVTQSTGPLSPINKGLDIIISIFNQQAFIFI